MEWSNLITAVAGLLIGSGGVLFHKQNKQNKEIVNVTLLAAEWEKLYREQKAERERNSDRIEQLTQRVFELEQKVNRLEIENEQLKNK